MNDIWPLCACVLQRIGKTSCGEVRKYFIRSQDAHSFGPFSFQILSETWKTGYQLRGDQKKPIILQSRSHVAANWGGGGQRLSKVVVLHRSPWQPSDRGYATADQTLFYPAEGFNDVSRERGGGVALFSAVDLFAGSAPRSLLGFSLLLLPLCLILNTALLNQKSSSFIFFSIRAFHISPVLCVSWRSSCETVCV